MSLCSKRTEKFLIFALRKQTYPTHLHDVRHKLAPAFLAMTVLNNANNVKRTYSESHKNTLTDNILKVVKQAETFQKASEILSRPQGVSPKQWKSSRYIRQLLPHLFSEDGQLLPTKTVEDQLRGLMLIWELEEAVKVLKESVKNGYEPNSTLILDLLQQLANMGEVGCLLDLYEFLKDKGLTTNLRFYHCLRDAYFNSGRIEEGIAMLRIIYHSTRDFNDADMFFTLLTAMIMKHFDHRQPLIESFVDDLEKSDPPVPSVRASLWRCLVLAEKFEAADALLAKHEHLKKMVPEQVTKIVQSSLQIDYNKDRVLKWLLCLPLIKAGLKASVFDLLIVHKSEEGEWLKALELLSSAMDQGIKVHQQTVQVFLTRFLGQLSSEQVQQLSAWADKLEKALEDDNS